MNHENSKDFDISQKEEKIYSELMGDLKTSGHIPDISSKNETPNEVLLNNVATSKEEEANFQFSSDDDSIDKSSNPDLQDGENFRASGNTDGQTESLENFILDLDFDALLLKPKGEILQYTKEYFQKLVQLLEDSNKRHEKELAQCQVNYSASIYEDQIKALEKELVEAKEDSDTCRINLKNIQEKLSKENIAIRTDLTTRLERLTKQCEVSNREKEAMVMKFAKGEKEVLLARKHNEMVEKKVRELDRDKEILQGKIKTLSQEKARISNTFDNKIQELGIATRNIDKLKEESNAKDIKIKWGQAKLKAEMDAHKDTQVKLDRSLAKICNHEQEMQTTKDEAARIVKETKEGENNRANLLDKQLKETKALLILEKQKHNDISALYKQLKIEHDSVLASRLLLNTEATTLRVKVSKYEQDKDESEKLFDSLQVELRNVKQESADLAQKLSLSSSYAEQLESEKVKAGFAEKEIKDLQLKLKEEAAEMTSSKEREAELLSFTQKLTNKDATLRSQLTVSQEQVHKLELEYEKMKNLSQSLQVEVGRLNKEIAHLKEAQKIKEEQLSSLLKEKMQEANNLHTKVSDLTNEIQVQQKKHNKSLKDSNREVQKLWKKLETLEITSTPNFPSVDGPPDGMLRNGDHSPSLYQQDTLSMESRASSNISLNAPYLHINSTTGNTATNEAFGNSSSASPANDLSQQILIDHIDELKTKELEFLKKIEFHKQHTTCLTSELQKKNKIIFHYIMREDAGALSNARFDIAKAEIIKHGGIMASVYGSAKRDETMTLDVSLEINRKLQAVLEDILLKNITLKENLNTLGNEVAKLALAHSSIAPS